MYINKNNFSIHIKIDEWSLIRGFTTRSFMSVDVEYIFISKHRKYQVKFSMFNL